jgi:hypothetical protein
MAQIHICHQPLPRITDANGTAFGEIADAAKLPSSSIPGRSGAGNAAWSAQDLSNPPATYQAR